MKKKVLTLMVIAALGFSSCKKDELATPSVELSTKKVADKSVVGNWDQLEPDETTDATSTPATLAKKNN